MTTFVLDNPSASAAENVARIKIEIARANKHYIDTGEKATVQLGVGTWIVTGDKSGDKDDASTGAIELLSGVTLTGSGNRQTVIKLEDNFNARINGIVRTDIADVENVTISNLVIDGNRANNTTGDPLRDHQAGFICGAKPDENGVPRVQKNITIDSVEVRNCTAYGFNPHETTYNMVIKNSIAHNNGLDGFVADHVIGGTYVGNISYDNDRHGFNIQNASQDLILRDNVAYDNGFRYINKEGEPSGGAGITIQRGDIAPNKDDPTNIPWVSNIQILGGSYYDNGKEGILVKLSEGVTINGAEIYGNKTQGVKIEGAKNTTVTNSTIYSNAQGDTPTENYDEINIRQRIDTITGNTYYSTGTQILDNLVTPEKARYAIHEEDKNKLGPATGTVIEGNVTGGTPTDGADTLTGSGGLDTMAGGKGDDTYYVNKTGDVITENPGEGTDHVFASAKYTLGANVEKLTLTGTAEINGYGNELDNVLTGNGAANTLEGLGGADALFGAGGNDTLKGGAGNDYLDGGVGADSMVGSTGDDIYIVDNSGDFINEDVGGGYDHIFSSASYTISNEVEELTLTGTANLTATGNGKANTLNGNAGNNTINGGAGADTMRGGGGDDTYYVDNSLDKVVEAAGEGIDTIKSTRAFTRDDPLAANVENLELLDPVNPNDPLAKWAIEGAGNELNNLIVGNSANNKLYGNGGNDTIMGGVGNDTIDGGADKDTAKFFGNRANYTINGTLGNRTVEGGTDGKDTLLNIEVLQFDNGMLIGDTWVPTLIPPPPSPPPANTGNQAVTRNGTSRSETLNGRDNIDDTIKGQGGNDTIKGRDGNDKLYGGDDNDKVYGESGDDRVYGDRGNDYVNGGSGNDYAHGGSGNDRVYGSSGSDRAYGSSGDDYVNGGSGDDYVHGGSGNDRVYGSTGNDRVYGSSGNDRVYGDSGNDWVYGDSGNDTVYGGTGDDVINGGLGNDRLYGNSGSDAFVFNSKLGTASSDRNVNFDTIVGFNVSSDSLLLDNAIFKKLGSGTPSSPTELNAEFFTSSGKARERDDYLIYNKKTGVLSYDADGSGSREAVEFAQLSKNLKLTYKDFFII